MKISKYINKYDYIGYFTKPKNTWFFSNSEIEFVFNSLIKKNNIENNFDIYDELENDGSDENDSYNYYELYKEALLKGEIKKDDDDPRVYEGNIIDEKTKEFITIEYPEITLIIDFDSPEYRWKSIEELFEISKKIISENENVIIFQPTLIYNDLITRPDAFIKTKNDIHIIETKGTSTSKINHFLDIFFQSKVVEKAVKEAINKKEYKLNFYYSLCLVKYEKLNAKDISFILSSSFNATKTFTSPKQGSMSDEEFIKEKGEKKIGIRFDKKSEETYQITFNKCVRGDYSDFINENDKQMKDINDIYETFNQCLDELRFVKNEQMNFYLEKKTQPFPTSFFPSWRDKGKYKNSSLWPLLKNYYAAHGFKNFLYSGNSTEQSIKNIIENYEESNLNINEIKEKIFFKGISKDWFDNNKNDITVLQDGIDLFAKLKNKKVYFDFETINSAIRAFDDTTPFTQVVTQCSILIDRGEGFEDAICKNLLTDPYDIKLSFFKEIVDELFQGNDYSYVVYNITFERSRLNEFKRYINDEEYTNKIDIIIDNLFDLADFFNFTRNKQNIFLKKLQGYYSIKKVLPIIKNEYPDIFNQTKCIDYKSLEIGDGLMCQNATTKRFFNLLTEKEWNDLSNNLKLYCENDVRAMVAVEYYIAAIIKKYS